MWTVLKFDKKKINFLKQDLKKKIGDNLICYSPKIKVQKFKKNKLIDLEFNILGNYLFCFHKCFEKKDIFNNLQFCRGLKYFLVGANGSQGEIVKFIEKLKSLENNKGFISNSFFELKKNNDYKFSSGPFADKIFKIIDLQKNKINILMGNIKTTIKKQKLLFKPV